MPGRFALVGTLALSLTAYAEVLSVGPRPFDYSTQRPAPPRPVEKKPGRLRRLAGYLFHHMDGHAAQRPLPHVDGTERQRDTMESAATLVWKIPW